MANLYVPALTLRLFHYDRESKTLSAEASDLGPLRDGCWWLGRLYDDACDQGITIESPYTGLVLRFILSNTIRNGDGETLAWVFRPEQPIQSIKSVLILND